jgi:DNA topoisomerase-1
MARQRTSPRKPRQKQNLAAARAARLVYVSDAMPGIRRQRKGSGFAYLRPDASVIRDPRELRRIRALAVPPAYSDVWICAEPNGHIQATGRDARGRKQYRYHPRWREVRDAAKYQDMIAFGRLLPGLRSRVSEDMGKRGLPREKVLATIVWLLQATLIRVGNEDYAKENQSFGLTTLRNRHVEIEGATLHFEFKGKSGKLWQLQLHDRRIARVVRACQELPGQELFQYRDEAGLLHGISSDDVNRYLREISGEDITAKHFRTWAGTVLAAIALSEFEAVDSDALAKKNIRAAIERVAKRLGNTPTICRKCYIHPEVLEAYLDGAQLEGVSQEIDQALENPFDLSREEAALLGLLNRRLRKDIAGPSRPLRAVPSGRAEQASSRA